LGLAESCAGLMWNKRCTTGYRALGANGIDMISGSTVLFEIRNH
jgi:hypothetical protein